MRLEGWSLNIVRWRELQVVLPALEWTTLPFDILSANRVPEAPGVYMITGAPPLFRVAPHISFEQPLYVGKSETSIRARFRAHTSGRAQPGVRELRQLYDDARHPALAFRLLALDASLVAQTESLLIECYGPPGNRQRGLVIKPGVPAG
jgi:hypothetical protein